jgi:hypothetical protein
MISPKISNQLNSYRVRASRESRSPQQNLRRFAKQHRNNADGRVFAAALHLGGEAAPERRWREDAHAKRPGEIPAFDPTLKRF